jgi:arylsulfatase A-like enzyme
VLECILKFQIMDGILVRSKRFPCFSAVVPQVVSADMYLRCAGENGLWGKCTLYESATRAPMLIRVPGVTDNGRKITALTEHLDLMPTLIELAGLPAIPSCPADGGESDREMMRLRHRLDAYVCPFVRCRHDCGDMHTRNLVGSAHP